MKVMLLISTRGLFGAENAVLELAKQLLLHGLEPHIGIIENSKKLYSPLETEANKNRLLVKIFRCRGKFDIRTAFEIRKYIRQNQITLIHSQGYKSNFYSLLASINTKIKRITTCHNWIGSGVKMKFYENLDKLLLNSFHKVIAVSDILKDEIIQNMISGRNVIVINNGVDVERFNAANLRLQSVGYKARFKEALGLRGDDLVVGAIGRFSFEKGYTFLLEAFKKIILEFPNLKLLFVGDGPLKETLESKVRTMDLGGKVIFAGIRNDIPELLSMIDIFVLPSLTEGLPMALLEAMAAQKPIIATRVGGIHELIENQKTGLLIEPGDVDTIVNSITLLLRNKEIKSVIAINAFKKVKNEFSSFVMAQNYLKLYKEVLGNGRVN